MRWLISVLVWDCSSHTAGHPEQKKAHGQVRADLQVSDGGFVPAPVTGGSFRIRTAACGRPRGVRALEILRRRGQGTRSPGSSCKAVGTRRPVRSATRPAARATCSPPPSADGRVDELGLRMDDTESPRSGSVRECQKFEEIRMPLPAWRTAGQPHYFCPRLARQPSRRLTPTAATVRALNPRSHRGTVAAILRLGGKPVVPTRSSTY